MEKQQTPGINQLITEKLVDKTEIKRILKQMRMRNHVTRSVRHYKSSIKRKIQSFANS